MTALEIVGATGLWLVGAVAPFYVPALLVLRRPGGLELFPVSIYIGGGCCATYIVASMIYFIAT